MKLQNLHTHTTFCDGEHTPAEMAEAAVACGCGSLGFSGHTWLPYDDDWTMRPEDLPRYREEVLALRRQYAGRLEVWLGLERDYFSDPPGGDWDYIIGSVHCLRKDGVYLPLDYTARQLRRAVEVYYGGDGLALAEDYFRLAGDVARQTGCQIVGHFDLLSKFSEDDPLIDLEAPRYQDAARAALDRLLAEDVIFEVNTGAVFRGYRTGPYPAPALLRYIRQGGGRICLTSDCHSADAILYGFGQAARLAEDCGFREAMVLTADGFCPVPLSEYR